MVQRVRRAEVRVEGERIGAIGPGILVLLGVARGDGEDDAAWLAEKLPRLRLFPGEGGAFDRSLIEMDGACLVVSQFTLFGEVAKGRRPDFREAAPADEAKRLYEVFLERLRRFPIRVECGRFGAHMEVALVNDGPVTLCIDTRERPAPPPPPSSLR